MTPDKFDSAAIRLIEKLQELNFPMPAIEGQINEPAEAKWAHTIAAILREQFGREDANTRPPGNDSGSA